jgi:hypothetical protein
MKVMMGYDTLELLEKRLLETCYLFIINWLKQKHHYNIINSRIGFRNTSKQGNFHKEIFIVIKPGPKKDPGS